MSNSQSNIPVGVVATNVGACDLYVIDPNQNLVQLTMGAQSSSWSANGLGMPLSGGLDNGVGVTNAPNGSGQTVAFAVGDNEIIQCNLQGNWSALPSIPNGISADAYLGVVANPESLNLVILGSDLNVWCCSCYYGVQNWSWQNLFAPSAGIEFPVGICGTAYYSEQSYVAVLGGDGNVYTANIGFGPWQSVGAPTTSIMAPIGIYLLNQSPQGPLIGIAVIDTANDVWTYSLAIGWTNLSHGTGSSPIAGIGTNSRNDLYVLSSDNSVWCYEYGSWVSLGHPSAQLNQPIGVADTLENVFTFLSDVYGKIWCFIYSENEGAGQWTPVI